MNACVCACLYVCMAGGKLAVYLLVQQLKHNKRFTSLLLLLLCVCVWLMFLFSVCFFFVQ